MSKSNIDVRNLKTDKIAGAIFPIPIELVGRLFDGKPKIFVKCLPRKSTRLVPKNKIIFYASHGTKELVGEGTIKKIEFLDSEAILSRYKERLFLDEDEFRAYVRGRKEILALALANLRKYSTPIKYGKNLTMAGQYITQVEYRSLVPCE
jgi:hypothetical protein